MGFLVTFSQVKDIGQGPSACPDIWTLPLNNFIFISEFRKENVIKMTVIMRILKVTFKK